MDEGIGVLEHEGSEHCVDLGGHRPGLRVAADARDELAAALGAQEVGNRAVAHSQYILELLLHSLVLFCQLSYQLILSTIIFVQIDEGVVDVAEGVEAPADVLRRGFEDLLQVLRPFREDSKHGGVARRKLLAVDFLLAKGLDKGGDLLA
jgi:hypothetical protein